MAIKRKNELSLMNVLLCLFVIFIHIASYGVTNFDNSSAAYGIVLILQRFASFAVQGFIFLAGVKFVFSTSKDGFSYSKYYLARLKRIVIPYLIASVVYYAMFVWKSYYTFSVKDFIKMFFDGTMTAHFYFVIIIVQFYLLAPLWKWLIKKLTRAEGIVVALFFALFFGMIFGQYSGDLVAIFLPNHPFPYSDRIFTTYLVFWVLGLAVGVNYERVVAYVKSKILPISLIWLIAAVMQALLSYINARGLAYVSWLGTVHTFYVLASITMTFAVCVRLAEKPIAESRAVKLVDKASYMIYLWHVLVIYIFECGVGRLGVSSVGLIFAFRFVFVFAVSIALCCLHEWFKELILRKNK